MAEPEAVAFHEAASLAKLEEVFPNWKALFTETATARCPKCQCVFAVFFLSSDEAKNRAELKALEAKMALECSGGRHSLELR